jgi:transposase
MASTKKETKLIRFVKRALNIILKARIPLRFSKFSNHIYSNYVHLILHMLRVSTGMSYVRFFEWIENFTGLWTVLGISTVPHFTTLQKFTARCPKRYLDAYIHITGLSDDDEPLITSIDSTGYSLTNASHYYTVTIKTRLRSEDIKPSRGRPRTRRPIRRYLKVTYLVNIKNQKVLAVSIRRGPDNDNKDFIRSFKWIEIYKPVEIGMVLADKGYDSEANHRYIREVIGADTIIPARENKSGDYRTRGKYRKEMRAGYDVQTYHKRSISETVNSVLKRKMGDCVRAKKVSNQNREILFMVLTYNTEKESVIYILILRFLESQVMVILINDK